MAEQHHGRIHLVPLGGRDLLPWAQLRIRAMGLENEESWSMTCKAYSTKQEQCKRFCAVTLSDEADNMYVASLGGEVALLGKGFDNIVSAMTDAYTNFRTLNIEGYRAESATARAWFGLMSLQANHKFLYVEVDYNGEHAEMNDFCHTLLGIQVERLRDYSYTSNPHGDLLSAQSWRRRMNTLVALFRSETLF
ncbi:hypothetical protein PTSG_04637 [Salpingoeca rosetta]|uniref:Uncharacterized protein n=1 Tax=Salpingoeca rosetta (strain ATCC 50818 / BSB-021) TaxID=946362 RepID=F2U803_SALR5|nr:uncharacterized protein PTSG_04637 [Salpingoeca rosetta]EGD72908.1 hypothetical protein PTSG_04637 [Salpingoeca rosetta]|eukprot:XP_004994730.1 hypothetical protein PTSG_04637 [Salpingoeca rosetta]